MSELKINQRQLNGQLSDSEYNKSETAHEVFNNSTDASVDNSVAFAAVAENMESSSDDTEGEGSVSEDSTGNESEAGSTYTDEDGDVYAVTDNTSKTETDSSDSSYSDYSDDNVSISVKQYTYNNTQVYVADITVSSAEYLKTALAENTYGKNVTVATSTIASENNAVLAINGDYYGAQESGYVIRNGQVYRSTSSSDTEICCIYADGTMKIMNSSEKSAEELVNEGVWQAFSFGPGLIEDGEISVTADEEVGKAMASNPRTAIGMISANHYVFVVSDGRTSESEGLSLSELAEFMQSLGVTEAYNLDGGGSSTMYYQGTVINKPTTDGRTIRERSVSDIVYVG